MAKTKNITTSYPEVGKKAPPFSAPASNGKTIRLADLKGSVVALYFYPKDNTPGCTTEACGFRDAYTRLTKEGIIILGVSPDSLDSHRKFTAKFNLPFPLLADTDQAICKAYGVWQTKSMYGREYMGVARTTFVIDRDGTIAHVFDKVKPDGHEAEVLDWISKNLKHP
ncbi:MAG TPA: thioredoxin-dependent thiol peroxidase [Phycisphaerae bacterium]|nr:thioredoxin-dependent thiol peroxidase [Phycisphaerae bacterium]HRY69425.1 thioredoxin-dependent thiol peroxidase [Phycisphaerae bacterium]HSA26292.1 thioredoxin-dependent thiol peroxidase [Phycisphaerae bacterium]